MVGLSLDDPAARRHAPINRGLHSFCVIRFVVAGFERPKRLRLSSVVDEALVLNASPSCGIRWVIEGLQVDVRRALPINGGGAGFNVHHYG